LAWKIGATSLENVGGVFESAAAPGAALAARAANVTNATRNRGHP
jgi:hypothetical protein